MDVESPVISSKPKQSTKKVGILLESVDDSRNYHLMLYEVVIDSETDSETDSGTASPVLQITFKVVECPYPTVCVLKSTLYIFGGCAPIDVKENPCKSKDACWKHVLQKDHGFKDLNTGDLQKVCPMHSSKSFPTAIPTPDGKKILVFGYNVFFKGAFELYDPQEDNWTILPPLPRTAVCCPHCWDIECSCVVVKTYSFIDESHFLLGTQFDRFVLDLGGREVKWEKWSHYGGISLAFQDYFVTADEGRYALTSSGECFYVTNGGFLSRDYGMIKFISLPMFPFKTLECYDEYNDEWLSPYYPSIIPLEAQGEGEEAVYRTCVLQIEPSSDGALLYIYVCRFKPVPLDFNSAPTIHDEKAPKLHDEEASDDKAPKMHDEEASDDLEAPQFTVDVSSDEEDEEASDEKAPKMHDEEASDDEEAKMHDEEASDDKAPKMHDEEASDDLEAPQFTVDVSSDEEDEEASGEKAPKMHDEEASDDEEAKMHDEEAPQFTVDVSSDEDNASNMLWDDDDYGTDLPEFQVMRGSTFKPEVNKTLTIPIHIPLTGDAYSIRLTSI